MQLMRNSEFERTLENADAYNLLVNTAVVSAYTHELMGEALKANNNLFYLYKTPKTVLHDDIFGVVCDFLCIYKGRCTQRIKAMAVSEGYPLWQEGCTAYEHWLWRDRFAEFRAVKKYVKRRRYRYNDYDFTDEFVVLYLARRFSEYKPQLPELRPANPKVLKILNDRMDKKAYITNRTLSF